MSGSGYHVANEGGRLPRKYRRRASAIKAAKRRTKRTGRPHDVLRRDYGPIAGVFCVVYWSKGARR